MKGIIKYLDHQWVFINSSDQRYPLHPIVVKRLKYGHLIDMKDLGLQATAEIVSSTVLTVDGVISEEYAIVDITELEVYPTVYEYVDGVIASGEVPEEMRSFLLKACQYWYER